MHKMSAQDYNQAAAHISALTGRDDCPIWWRCIHDTEKGQAAHKYYGTLAQLWETLCGYNNNGWGIFLNINEFAPLPNGLQPFQVKHNLDDVQHIRAHVADLDNEFSSNSSLQLAQTTQPVPQFYVNTSPDKYHVYWLVNPYTGNDYYSTLQRKIRQVYDGDSKVIDPTRVLRVAGFFHMKNPTAPHLVQCYAVGNIASRYNVEELSGYFNHVNVINTTGGRNELGDPALAAPSLDWLQVALNHCDPNTLDRLQWVSFSAAFKQAGWTLADETTLFDMWSKWCENYTENDPAENLKNWNSFRETQVGWNAIKRRVPVVAAYEKFGHNAASIPSATPNRPAEQQTQPVFTMQPTQTAQHQQTAQTVPQDSAIVDGRKSDTYGDILSQYECEKYFDGCFFIEKMGQILTPSGRFMNATQFNGSYGGKAFVIAPTGKATDEPFKAATRSTLWTIPKVDHIRFLPSEPPRAIIYDALGRAGVNTYIPVNIRRREGDPTPFLRHMELMLPDPNDRMIFFNWLAHNIKFRGYKIPWAPMIQSTEGVGKGIIMQMIEMIIGDMYVYSPKADELVKSGSTFNAWQRGKLMIIVDEIKVDEKRELIEILKPLITNERAEIQSKGVDQDMEDNPANWAFFSNYKDAIPVSQNGRRYSIFYSAIQSAGDLAIRGMDDAYFTKLFNWLKYEHGSEIVANYLLNLPIEKGDIPRRAPETSSQAEALKISRSPIEVAIANAVEDQVAGFRGGYISNLAVVHRCQIVGIRKPTRETVRKVIEGMGYVDIGRAPVAYHAESIHEKAQLFAVNSSMSVAEYGRAQNYE